MLNLDKEREEKALQIASIPQNKKYRNLRGIQEPQNTTINHINDANLDQPEVHSSLGIHQNQNQPELEHDSNDTTEPEPEQTQQARRSTRPRKIHNYKNLHQGNIENDAPPPTNHPQEVEPTQTTGNKQVMENELENIQEENEKLWVRNYSKRQLTPEEVQFLSKGAGFAITPKEIPIDDFIIATEQVCNRICHQGTKAALRGEISRILDGEAPPVSNITKKERQILQNLKNDESIVFLQADKGKCIVVMDKAEYIERMEEKLSDETTYKKINKDPTNELQKKLWKKLEELKNIEHITVDQFEHLKPHQCQIPRLSGRPKVHKPDHPLREILDGSGGVMKDTDKHLAGIIKPYAYENKFRLENSEDFVKRASELVLKEDEVLVSYDVVAMYPSIPQDRAITAINHKLVNDPELSQRTKMTPTEIIELLRMCLGGTYFVFNQQLYIQIRGLAIGASTSGFAADIVMEQVETTALATFINPPSFWARFVDDVYSNPKKKIKDLFLAHLNAQDEHLKWTAEEEKEKQLPYVDVRTMRQPDGTLKFDVYRKPTHTDQYLNFGSNHHMSQKLAVGKTLLRRADVLITEENDKLKEEAHVRKALNKCGYPNWAVQRKKEKEKKPPLEKDKDKTESIGRIFIPYVKHTSERIAREFRTLGAEVIYLPTTKIKDHLCSSSKDRVPEMDKAGVCYKIDIKCDTKPEPTHEDYIGETVHATKHRMYEHNVVSRKQSTTSTAWTKKEEKTVADTAGLRRSQRNVGREQPNYKELDQGAPMWLTEGESAVSQHLAQDHNHGDIQVTVLGREKQRLRRGIKEAIEIQRHKPSLNKNSDTDRYKLSPIYDSLIKPKNTRNNNNNNNNDNNNNNNNNNNNINDT